MRAPGNTRLTPRVHAERQRVKRHPLVVATDTAQAYIETHYSRRDWLLGIREQEALIGLTHGRVFADRVAFGLKSRLHLLNESWCVQSMRGGCQCKLELAHAPPHVCYCGKVFSQQECRPRGRGPGRKRGVA